ncbi:hypothetical protein BZA70DRAFT_286962 [Myxozyma melibiosi]|uniref:Uncharacterized protein n=1 Tax=Myxozyma melibiosi TaxID=54550 RepID=A0ABR1FCM9_9ASCO
MRYAYSRIQNPRVMWDSATISQWSPYPLRPDFNQRQPKGYPRIDGLSALSHDPPVLPPRALWPQSPSSPRRLVARTLVNSVATGPVRRHGLPVRVFQRRDNIDVLNPMSNLAKEESHQIDRPGLLQGDTRASTPKLESCLAAMVHEAPSKRDRCKTETGQDSPLASRWSRACKSSDRQAVASLLDMCSRKSRLRSSVPRAALWRPRGGLPQNTTWCIIGDSLHENATSGESSDYGINGIRGDR